MCPRRPLWRYEQRNVYGAIQKPCEAEAAALATQRQCRRCRRRPVSNSFQALRLVVSHTHAHTHTHAEKPTRIQANSHANMQSMVSWLSRRRCERRSVGNKKHATHLCLSRSHSFERNKTLTAQQQQRRLQQQQQQQSLLLVRESESESMHACVCLHASVCVCRA